MNSYAVDRHQRSVSRRSLIQVHSVASERGKRGSMLSRQTVSTVPTHLVDPVLCCSSCRLYMGRVLNVVGQDCC